MFAELVELGKRVRKGHDALKEEKCSWDIIIDKEGNYLNQLIPCNEIVEAENLTAKKGKARLLLDKPEETLGLDKPEKYLEKLDEYKDVQEELSPVLSFYNKPEEVIKALAAFMALPQSKRNGNMTFFYEHNKERPLSLERVQEAIKSKMKDGELEEKICSWDIIIDKDGNYKGLNRCDSPLKSERIQSTTQEARFLLDKAETTFGYGKYRMYLEKLYQYKDISALSPIFSFYNKPEEVNKVRKTFLELPQAKQKGNLTFMVDSERVLSNESVRNAIKKKYEEGLSSKKQGDRLCAVCGTNNYPILDEPHGSVKVPKGQTSGSMLVSYNTNAFESYNLKGNLNSGICTNCARNYIEALRYLVGNKFTNCQKTSDDTIPSFSTKEPDDDVDPFSDICQPTEERVRKLFSSIITGDNQRVNTDLENYFYCCTMSSSAARIAVRDWMAISIFQYHKNLQQWFDDIATIKDGETFYPRINSILNSCIKKKSKPTQSDAKAMARIGAILWHAALTNTPLPIMILQSVLTQIEHEKTTKYCKTFSPEESTVIRLVLNRNIKKTYYMKKELDEQNESKAYLCGRLFALICQLQYKAHEGKEVNSSIRDRFFTSASSNPSRAMSILLTKYVPIYQKKTKGAYTKSITEIASRIEHFPEKLTLTERGEFALGYYYQYAAKKNENCNYND